MLKALFIIGAILIAVVLATQPLEDGQGKHTEHHKRNHAQHVGQHHGQPTAKHGVVLGDKEHVNHGRINVPVAPHHSKSHRAGRRHKSPKSAKGSKLAKSHHRQQKATQHKKHSQKARGHGRKHQ